MAQPSRIEIRDDYEYDRLSYYSAARDADTASAYRHLTALYKLLGEDGSFPEASGDATPLLNEVEKILDALKEANGRDPQADADPEADEL